MKNKIIIPAVVAVFAISGVSTVGSGLQAYALTPEEEQITYVATIEGQLKILEKSIAQAKDLDTAYKYVTDYESAVQESLIPLTAANRLIVQNSIKLLKQKINNLKANNAAQAAKSSNDNLRQEVRNEIAALKNDIQNTNNRIAQEKDGIINYVKTEKDGIIKHVAQEKDGIIKHVGAQKAEVEAQIEKTKAEVEDQIKKAKTEFTAKIKDLEKKIAELEAKNNSQDDEIKALKAELASVRNSVSELDKKLDSFKAELNKEIKSLKAELDDKINNLKKELNVVKSSITELQDDVDDLFEEIDYIWAEIDDLLKKIKTESLEAEKRANEYTNSKIAELASRIENNLNERFGKVDKQIAKLNFKGLTAPNTGVERQNSNALLALSSMILTLISSAVAIRKKF
ncbi:MAG: hypothetical protein Q4A23_01915 [bacterium]|nr:hypothetical protein [bacterium]